VIEEVRAAGRSGSSAASPRGPSYLGALLAHWLDGIAGFYAAALLLSRLLLREEGELR
jgi:hypothetical protein